MASFNREYLSEHKLFRKKNSKIFVLYPLLAILVAIIIFWWLKLVGITVTSEAFCGIEVHQHEEGCYAAGELICKKIEHLHSADCFPNKSADLETSADWKKAFEGVEFSNNVAENLIHIAQTQVGYRESALNYELDQTATKQGYTRYGEWYGSPYNPWNTLYISFCLNYSNINNCDDLMHLSAESMLLAWRSRNLYESSDTYSGARGDLVFFDDDADHMADRTAILLHIGENRLHVLEGDVDGAVEKMTYEMDDTILGFGKTNELYTAEHITDSEEEEPEGLIEAKEEGTLLYYIPMRNSSQKIMNQAPLTATNNTDHSISYSSQLDEFLTDVIIKDSSGNELGDGAQVYIGETYIVSLEFAEINKGSNWFQFQHDADGHLTYNIPENLHCVPFDDWHSITAKTESGTIEDVGEYFIDENGLLKVRFFEDKSGVYFFDKYSNVDFNIDFNTLVVAPSSDSSSEITFNDKINVNLKVSEEAEIEAVKTHGDYDGETHTMDYTIRIEAIHGVITDLVLDDEIWDSHYAMRDTIVVKDLDGNLLDPQPTISDHPRHHEGANEGFRLSDFPDFHRGEGFIIEYKSSIADENLNNATVDMWNGAYASGKNSAGKEVAFYIDNWERIELERLNKNGRQSFIEDNNGNSIPIIEWEVEVKKTPTNLHGTVVIDTLGEGLAYYTDKDILIRRYDANGNPLSNVTISWDDITITNNSMNFQLPEGHAFNIIYYTTFEELDAGEEKEYHNTVQAYINGANHQSSGTANVVGFTPNVKKTASGNDGKFVYFDIKVDVPSVIKDRGYFYLTDLAAFWGYKENAEGHLYVENKPQDMVVTAVTAGGETITFTPYQEGGTIENTFLLMAPAGGDQHHSFNLFFNTADPTTASSKWILDEQATLTISYKLPFTAATGVEWNGPLSGTLYLEEVLLSGYHLANEVYFNYTNEITTTASTNYDYSPKITKHAIAHDDGIIDYTVMFNNTVPGSGGGMGYINNSVNMAWFTDTFDERLEYVPGSLTVTGYSPWIKDLWIVRYRYKGEITGNTINVGATDFLFDDYNEAADASGLNGFTNAENFQTYYHWMNGGGRFVFSYQLRVKDEYLNTADNALLIFDNTAELLWDEHGSSGPVTDTTEIKTGLLDKTMAQRDSQLDYAIEINRNALDVMPNADTLEVVDTMKDNLSIYWESIKLYYHTHDHEWIDFSSEQSEHTFSVTFDPPTNSLTFIIPDGLHVKITYTTLITEHGLVTVHNAVKITGKNDLSTSTDAKFQVTEHSGDASGFNHSTTLMKEDAITDEPLPNAEILLYGPMGDDDATPPDGAAQSIVVKGGQTLRYIGSYTTGADGTVKMENQYLTMGGPYALVEHKAPDGYEKLKDPVLFYFYEPDPNGVIQTITTIVVVENAKWSAIIPETGGAGPLFTAITGIALMAFSVLYIFFQRKRERRLK